jgi:phosphoribosylaminoimidazolecarboxamide formyltransferase/IMP cyclohydrolase
LADALIRACADPSYPARVVALGADRPAEALDVARGHGIATFSVYPADFPSRSAWDAGLASAVAAFNPDLVVSAGFMRILGEPFLARFGDRTINTHPALLPAFPGAHAVRDALAAGVTATGCSIHQVDSGVDTGPVIAQRRVDVLAGDTEASLHERIKVEERGMLVDAVARIARGELPLPADGPAPGRRPIHRALVSVSDKTGLAALARNLAEAGVEIVSTGSTASVIGSAGVAVTPVEAVTGFPECLGGRVKTLHPRIHAGILADLRKSGHADELAALGVAPFDLVVVNLYPFVATVASGASPDECVEQIDIGGPAMLRAAAKNFPSVAVVTSPDRYGEIAAALAAGGFTLEARRNLARDAFQHTANYDVAVATWMTSESLAAANRGVDDAVSRTAATPCAAGSVDRGAAVAANADAVHRAGTAGGADGPADQGAAVAANADPVHRAGTAGGAGGPAGQGGAATSPSEAVGVDAIPGAGDELPAWFGVTYQRSAVLRYGENPHQAAAVFEQVSGGLAGGLTGGLARAVLLGGKPMSFNNYGDADAAWRAALDFAEPCVAIIKHANPCGIAVGRTIAEAHSKAHACDPLSALGGVIAANRPVSAAMAEQVAPVFTEVIIAPDYEPAALEILRAKKNLRILRLAVAPLGFFEAKPISGGTLVQERDLFGAPGDRSARWVLAAGTPAAPSVLADLEFAWKAVRSVKSNAILLAKDGAAVGVGMGQVNRVDSAILAARRAGAERARGAVAASDAFFPFADGLEVLINAGVTAVVEPGGSVRDAEVVAAANAGGLTLYFTGSRHFYH